MKSEITYPNGHIVYEPYAPLNYGKIIGHEIARAGHNPHLMPLYTVRWKDGTTSKVWPFHLKSLEELIEDHEKKLAGHKARLAKAQAEL